MPAGVFSIFSEHRRSQMFTEDTEHRGGDRLMENEASPFRIGDVVRFKQICAPSMLIVACVSLDGSAIIDYYQCIWFTETSMGQLGEIPAELLKIDERFEREDS
jgi:uncharacterized protein YodC (DUF2158 family)